MSKVTTTTTTRRHKNNTHADFDPTQSEREFVCELYDESVRVRLKREREEERGKYVFFCVLAKTGLKNQLRNVPYETKSFLRFLEKISKLAKCKKSLFLVIHCIMLLYETSHN